MFRMMEKFTAMLFAVRKSTASGSYIGELTEL